MRAVWGMKVMLNKRSGEFYRGIRPRDEAAWLYEGLDGVKVARTCAGNRLLTCVTHEKHAR